MPKPVLIAWHLAYFGLKMTLDIIVIKTREMEQEIKAPLINCLKKKGLR
jgi:hypothetical protein